MSSCPNLVLVEARHDGRLTETDEASLARHLRTCAACTERASDLEQLRGALRRGDDAIAPLAHRRARANLLRAAAAPAPSLRARSWVWAPVAFAAAAAAVVALTAIPWGGDAPDRAAPLASVRTRTVVLPEPGARFERVDEDGVDRVDLHEGAVRAEVRKLGEGERFVVRTRDAEVEVRGTIFRVEAEHGVLRGVIVEEGAVEVRVGDAAWRVEAGRTWQPGDPASATPVAVPTSEPDVVEPPAASSAPVGSSAGRPAAAPAGPPAGLAGGPTPSRPTPSPSPSSPPSPPGAVSSAPREPAASRALQEGIAAIERGDYGQASRTLEEVGANESDPERAELAQYLAAVALQRAGRPDDARRAAAGYIAKHPSGRFVREARQILEGR